MENHVERLLKQNGIEYTKETSSSEWPQIANTLGNDKKRFDFAIRTADTTYLLEVNFYSKGGSKLNEVARAYSELAQKVNSVDGFEFVWVTDGIGWQSARNKLAEAYFAIPKVYNLADFKRFIASVQCHRHE